MGISAKTVSSYAVHESLGTQAEASGNNQIVVTDDIQNIGGNNGQVTGTDYIGRVIVLNLSGEGSSGDEQTRVVVSDVAGTGNLRILTVSQDWDTNPSTGTSDTIHVFYNMGDMEGVSSVYNTRTGFYEMGDPVIVGNGTDVAGLFWGNGELVEIEDSKSSTVYSLEVQNAGRLQCGYLLNGNPVSGAYMLGINNSQGEAFAIFESGSQARLYDSRLLCSLNPLQLNCVSGSDVQTDGFSIFQGTDEGFYFDSFLKNGSITGANTTSEIIRCDAGTTSDGLALIGTDGLQTASGDTTTEAITMLGVSFISNNNLITLNSNKTWNMINPVWGATVYSDFVWTTSTANYVYDKRSVDVVVQESDGTKLQTALVIIYENTLDDLVVEGATDVNGVVSDSFTYKLHETNSATTTYSGHALRIDKWLYTPFVAGQVSTDIVAGSYTLLPDSNIVETTQATAISAGSGIVWSEDTNPSSTLSFTAGANTLTVGETVTGGTSGATGIVTEIIDGDSATGIVHLKTRNATPFTSGGEALSSSGTWTGTMTAASEQEFSVWIDANSKTAQVQHDYWAARTAESPLNAIGEIAHELVFPLSALMAKVLSR